MRQRCVPPPGSEQEKQLSFRPPDPAWAPVEALAKARAALKRYDPFLDLWWSPVIRMNADAATPGRWTIKCWGPNSGEWDTVHIWEGPNNVFRNEFPEDTLIETVAFKDRWRKIETANESWIQRVERMHRENDAKTAKHEMNHRTETWREAADKAWYDGGLRFNVPVSSAQQRFEARQKRARRKNRK